jgi:hypothetical protein
VTRLNVSTPPLPVAVSVPGTAVFFGPPKEFEEIIGAECTDIEQNNIAKSPSNIAQK